MSNSLHITEVTASPDELIHITEHQHCYVNAYKGCSEGCSFCYWEDLPGWTGQLEVRRNAPELLDAFLESWDKERYLYIGSYSNPYEPLVEPQYRLTRQLLQVLKRHQSRFLLATSTKGIIEDIPLLQEMRDRAVIVVELNRIHRLKQLAVSGYHEGIEAANTLQKNGITVWTTLAPYLPGISDLQAVLDGLAEDIPVYVDALDAAPGTPMHARVLHSIRAEYPELASSYDRMIRDGTSGQALAELLDRYSQNQRVRQFPYPLD